MTEVVDTGIDVEQGGASRRTFLQLGAAGAAAVAVGATSGLLVPDLKNDGFLSKDGVFDAASVAMADALYTEVFPTSPLIMEPFKDVLPVPRALASTAWTSYSSWSSPPGNGLGQQDSCGGTHQKWGTKSTTGSDALQVYEIDVKVGQHGFTSSSVMPINNLGQPTVSFDASGNQVPAGTVRTLPQSTIYGFNGTFPGPRINAEYGTPCLIRFRNKLDDNPDNLDRQDFGAPDLSFLTHLHNAHTAPESDGNPHYSMNAGPRNHGYQPGQWVDNLYLNWPAGGLDSEKQSFFWFHDHRMDHTGANVYKGMVGLYPIYDPKGGRDMGDETPDPLRRPANLRFPGRRTNYADGTFDVDYDIPLVLFDCRLDDGVTVHHDMHDGLGEYPAAQNPRVHPEWWGKTFFKHFPNHGFVGDIFTVNGTAYPQIEVERRKYRLRFLDASIARCYELQMMTSSKGPKSAASLGYTGDELQGQYRIPDGQQCMKWTQIAADGGILPFAIQRNSFELWPAKRREFIVDFTRYMDGTPTSKGDIIYLTNIMKMTDGRKNNTSSRTSLDPNYKVPLVKFIIGDTPIGDKADQSMMPGTAAEMRGRPDIYPLTKRLATLPSLPSNWKSMMDNRMIFEVERGSAGGELEWLVNGRQFDPTIPATSFRNPAGKSPLAQQKKGSFNLWEVRNGGGGWIHPFHLHMEEHRVVMRNGKDVVAAPDGGHPDDASKEDLINLDPSESVIIYRGFRDFTGKYVAHCHNLAHEDHAMMFGWEIT